MRLIGILGFLLLAPIVPVTAQPRPARPYLTGFLGASNGHDSGALLGGIELRSPALGRVSLAAAGSFWTFFAGCDLLIGNACEFTAKGVELGPVVRLTTSTRRSWALDATIRVGVLWYNGADRRVWNPSAGMGVAFGTHRRVNGRIDFRYYAPMSSRPHDMPYRPNTDDGIAILLGLQVRL